MERGSLRCRAKEGLGSSCGGGEGGLGLCGWVGCLCGSEACFIPGFCATTLQQRVACTMQLYSASVRGACCSRRHTRLALVSGKRTHTQGPATYQPQTAGLALSFQRPPSVALVIHGLAGAAMQGIHQGRCLQPSNGRWPNIAQQPLAHDGCFLSQTEKSLVALACRIPIPSVFPVISITLSR